MGYSAILFTNTSFCKYRVDVYLLNASVVMEWEMWQEVHVCCDILKRWCDSVIFVLLVTTGQFHDTFPSIFNISTPGQAELNDLLGMKDLNHSARTELIHLQIKSSFQ